MVRSHSARGLSTQARPLFVAQGVTLTIHEIVDDAGANDVGVLAVRVTLANGSGISLRVRHRDFALSADAGARYPALLPSELGPKRRDEVLLREGVLGTGDNMSAVLYFRMPPRQSPSIELRVDLADVHDTPIAQTFLPIHRATGDRS